MIGLGLIHWYLGFAAFAVILLILVAGNAGTGQWIPGGIGDDTNAAIPKRREGPPDY